MLPQPANRPHAAFFCPPRAYAAFDEIAEIGRIADDTRGGGPENAEAVVTRFADGLPTRRNAMDSLRFDALARTLAGGLPRRRVLRLLSVGGLAAAVGLGASHPVAARTGAGTAS